MTLLATRPSPWREGPFCAHSAGAIDDLVEDWVRTLGGLDNVWTLQHRNEHLVRAVYHFFQSVCMSPSFTLSDWFLLYHGGNMDDWKN
jgi:hypothetical protein